MTGRRQVTLIFSLLLGFSFAGSVFTVRQTDRLRPTAALQSVLFIPSPQVVKRLSLGYSGLAADIYWTRAVQYFGSQHAYDTTEYRLLYPLLNITTSLDPHLIPAYEFGSMFLTQRPPIGAGEPQKAVELLERGIAANATEWRLYQDLGFVYYLELKDFALAGKAFQQASEIPGAHPFLKIMAAKTLAKGGDLQTSKMLWGAMYDSTKSEAIRDNAIKHLRAIQVDEDVPQLENIVRLYQQRAGRPPVSFSELVQAGWLRRTPRDPLGYAYKIALDGRVEVAVWKKLPFITKGLPPDQKPSDHDWSVEKK